MATLLFQVISSSTPNPHYATSLSLFFSFPGNPLLSSPKVCMCSVMSMDCSLPDYGSSAHGIFQTRILEWGAISSSTQVHFLCPHLCSCPTNWLICTFLSKFNGGGGGGVTQSCPTFCNPTDCSPPGSSIHGIFQARVLEWAAISFSGDLPDPGIEPRSPTL